MSSKSNYRGSKPNASKAPSNANHQQNANSQWRQRYEYYCDLAEKAGAGDRVAREQYWQHAEHFFRLMNGSAQRQE